MKRILRILFATARVIGVLVALAVVVAIAGFAVRVTWETFLLGFNAL